MGSIGDGLYGKITLNPNLTEGGHPSRDPFETLPQNLSPNSIPIILLISRYVTHFLISPFYTIIENFVIYMKKYLIFVCFHSSILSRFSTIMKKDIHIVSLFHLIIYNTILLYSISNSISSVSLL
jgi:hypothetical protein